MKKTFNFPTAFGVGFERANYHLEFDLSDSKNFFSKQFFCFLKFSAA
jgi:hypothetical protein